MKQTNENWLDRAAVLIKEVEKCQKCKKLNQKDWTLGTARKIHEEHKRQG